jgi:RHS repeat-associated protein
MVMPLRQFTSGSSYRYGFNGKEEDDEVKGNGNQQDYGMRIYDTRLGRFLSVDPISKEYPELTPYQFAENSPILFIDLDGLEKALPWYLGENKNGGKPVLTLGLGKLPTANKLEYRDYAWYTDQSITTFVNNSLVAAWNGLALSWNDALDGKTGTDMLAETVQGIEKIKPSDFKKVSTWENLVGAAVTIYVSKRLFSFEVSPTAAKSIRGTWVAESTKGWSARAIEYQEYVTGVKAGTALEVNGVRFDGIRGNTLLEAKSSYDNFVNKKTGQFQDWYKNSKTGGQSLLDQAQRQIKAANGADIEWNFSTQKTLDATRSYFESQGIKGITYKLNIKP